jgi:hypothetical protein
MLPATNALEVCFKRSENLILLTPVIVGGSLDCLNLEICILQSQTGDEIEEGMKAASYWDVLLFYQAHRLFGVNFRWCFWLRCQSFAQNSIVERSDSSRQNNPDYPIARKTT